MQTSTYQTTGPSSVAGKRSPDYSLTVLKLINSYTDEIRLNKTGHHVIFLSEKSFKNQRSEFKDVFAKNYSALTAKDVDNLKQALTTLSAGVQAKIDKEVVVLTGLENL